MKRVYLQVAVTDDTMAKVLANFLRSDGELKYVDLQFFLQERFGFDVAEIVDEDTKERILKNSPKTTMLLYPLDLEKGTMSKHADVRINVTGKYPFL